MKNNAVKKIALATALVTVNFGMNDVARLSLEAFRSGMLSIIDQCEKGGSEVLLCTPNYVYETKRRPNEKLAQFADEVVRIGKEQGLGAFL
jgi:hypothetical protein